MLPNEHSTTRQIAIFDALYHRPMTVSNGELAEVINIKLDDHTTQHPGQGVHFYLRSYALTAPQLRVLIKELDGLFVEVKEWELVVDLFAPKQVDSGMLQLLLGYSELD